MNNFDLVRQKQRLDGLFAKVQSLGHDIELQAHWSQYLCVLVSGFIESAVITVFSRYATAKADRRVADYVSRELQSFQNPKMGKILELSGAFSREWQENLEKATIGELKDAVDSVVSNRHLIAHGRPVGLSYSTIKDYYKRVIRVVELIETQCAA